MKLLTALVCFCSLSFADVPPSPSEPAVPKSHLVIKFSLFTYEFAHSTAWVSVAGGGAHQIVWTAPYDGSMVWEAKVRAKGSKEPKFYKVPFSDAEYVRGARGELWVKSWKMSPEIAKDLLYGYVMGSWNSSVITLNPNKASFPLKYVDVRQFLDNTVIDGPVTFNFATEHAGVGLEEIYSSNGKITGESSYPTNQKGKPYVGNFKLSARMTQTSTWNKWND